MLHETQQKYRIKRFYKETQFQKTPVGKIPREWRLIKIRELATLLKRGKTPEYGDSNVIVIKTAHVYPGRIKFEEAPRASPSFIKKLPSQYFLKPGDILINSTGTGSVGRVGFFNGCPETCTVDSHVTILRVNTNIALSKFVFYYLSSPIGFKALVSKAVGSTNQIELYTDAIGDTLIPLPPLEEQWGIAEVLSSVDNAIEAVERLIEKLERIKQGLMQELLTKGIGHREFKETPIGKTPKGWQVVKLSDISTIIMGQSPPSSTYNDDGVGLPFLQGKAEFGRIYPTPLKYTSKPLKIIEKGDLLISVRAPVGDVNIAPFKLCIGRGLAGIHFDPNKADTFFYFYYFQSAKPRLETLGKGSTFKAITRKELESLLVPLPPLEEQRRIASILKSIDDWIEVEEQRKEKLERLKRGLMDLLLTGRVRVVVDG